MKSICSRIFVLLALFAFSPSFSQEIKKAKGKVTTYYDNGKKEASGKVKNFKKQGKWKYWDIEGHLEKIVMFKDDQLQGLYTEYYHDGSISQQGNYSASSEKTGVWNSYYQGGKKASVLNYAGNQFDGMQQWWYENGQLREQSMYSKGEIVYRWTWHYNGRKKTIETYANGLADGTWRTYPPPSETNDTLPSSIDHYSNGKKNGLHIGYSYGKRTEEINYKDDKLDGSYQKWDETGVLGISENYKNGERDGLCKYYDKGKLMREAEYKNGKLNGSEREYYFNTTETKTSWYRNGVLDSVYTYFKNGKIESTRIYRYYPGFVKTEEFSFYTEYDSTGRKLIEGEYHFEARNRYWVTYYPNGKMKSQTPYSSGKIIGTYKKWYTNGKPLIEMECDGSNVISQPKVWDDKGKPIKPGTTDYEAIVESSKPGEVYNDPMKYRSNRTTSGGTIKYVEPPAEMPSVQEAPLELVLPQSDNGVKEPAPKPDNSYSGELFTYVEQVPEFPGGQTAFSDFLHSRLVYPETAKEAAKQGVVYLEFIVETDGAVSNVKVKKGVAGAPELDAEAVRVLRLSPNWIPGKQNGKPVRVLMTIPVRFSLN